VQIGQLSVGGLEDVLQHVLVVQVDTGPQTRHGHRRFEPLEPQLRGAARRRPALADRATIGRSRGSHDRSLGTRYAAGVMGSNWLGWAEGTTPPPTPSAPSLVSPSNGATNVAQPVTLDWNNVANAVSYEVQIDNSSTTAAPLSRT
jgi:hypothetical protein